MERFIFYNKNGLWYELKGDYYYPCLELPAEEGQSVGVWGQRHLRYIRQHRKALYIELVSTGTLNSYLANLDQQAADMFSLLVGQLAVHEGVTEQLKAEDEMVWVGRMNNIQNRAREIVNHDLIFA